MYIQIIIQRKIMSVSKREVNKVVEITTPDMRTAEKDGLSVMSLM